MQYTQQHITNVCLKTSHEDHEIEFSEYTTEQLVTDFKLVLKPLIELQLFTLSGRVPLIYGFSRKSRKNNVNKRDKDPILGLRSKFNTNQDIFLLYGFTNPNNPN